MKKKIVNLVKRHTTNVKLVCTLYIWRLLVNQLR